MDKKLQLEYKKEIDEIKWLNLETLFLISQYALQNIIESADNYALSKWVVTSYIKVMREETVLLNFLKRNLDKIDARELDNILDMLDEANENTMMYFYGFLDNIQENLDFFKKYSFFKKITDTDKYRKEIYGTTLNLSHIQEFLGIKNKTWENLKKRTIITEDESLFGVNIKLDDNIIEDIKIFVPPIKNLKTAMINVHEFRHAYDICQMTGLEYIDSDYEVIARKSEKEFEDKYIKKKVKQYF